MEWWDKNFLFILMVLISIVFYFPANVKAMVSGKCSNCHTMHNSQSGSPMAMTGNNTATKLCHKDLLRKSCVGCHTGTNAGVIGSSHGSTPYVFSTTPPIYGVNTLAGGNFYWVLKDPTKGHNCLSIPGMQPDPYLSEAPGMPNAASGTKCASCHRRIESCMSCHNPKHHANDKSSPVVGKSGGFYRFLNSSFHPNDTTGVIGIEDDDWEYTVSSSDHNEYMGCNNLYGYDDNSMSNYCAGCHQHFHGIQWTDTNGKVVADGKSPWFMHPTSLALSDATGDEYQYYNNGNGYSPLAPVARDPNRLLSMTHSTSQVWVKKGESEGDQVMCLSCHRAHGSPYQDMLRWDYKACISGTYNSKCGCFVCHTTKDK